MELFLALKLLLELDECLEGLGAANSIVVFVVELRVEDFPLHEAREKLQQSLRHQLHP